MIKSNRFQKIIHWEHWPTSFFYVPNLPYAFYLAIKAKHPAFFSAVNPAIKSSGNGTESKFKTIQLVPKKQRPKTLLISNKIAFEDVLLMMRNEKIHFPAIAKPDIGFRGLLVEKINDETHLKKYLEKYPIPILIQEFLDLENECGIFYHRKPHENSGTISSITLKRFLTVTGDGTSSLKELILADHRAKLYFDLFQKIHQESIENIPEKGKVIKLTAIGNHSKGTVFINGNHLISKKLTKTFDVFSHQIEGWYYGRIDLKYGSFEALENGDFKVLEINGIISEPTHIYDAKKGSYFNALKSIRTHWKFIYEIANINHKKRKIPYKSPKKFINEMFELKNYTRKIKELAN